MDVDYKALAEAQQKRFVERRTSEEKELLEDIKCCILDTLDEEWRNHLDNYEFNTREESEAYGDTFVSRGRFITDESDTKCRESFKQDHDALDFIDKLKADPYFVSCVKNLINEYADKEDYDV